MTPWQKHLNFRTNRRTRPNNTIEEKLCEWTMLKTHFLDYVASFDARSRCFLNSFVVLLVCSRFRLIRMSNITKASVKTFRHKNSLHLDWIKLCWLKMWHLSGWTFFFSCISLSCWATINACCVTNELCGHLILVNFHPAFVSSYAEVLSL